MNKAHLLALALALTPLAAACTATAPPTKEVTQPPAAVAPVQDQTGIAIDLIRMAMTNHECGSYEAPRTWQDMMLPPRKAKGNGSDGC